MIISYTCLIVLLLFVLFKVNFFVNYLSRVILGVRVRRPNSFRHTE